ncbi:unnamed protein product [Mytilus edulis]|uniref:Uncharacterized protein n=1 Tax=Mytilus edulis TaxID=6550 RepID=A0A8S3V2C1_MYTED|nr:unnamed protein product [Mytilus edulis]
MQHELELKEVSVSLYKYMCEKVVGSENVVRYRRLYCKLNDEIFDDSSSAIISSGSKAEGLDLTGSDYDIMFLAKNWLVYETKPNDDEDVIVLDTDNALPGFALLKVSDNTAFPCPTTVTSNGNYIANVDYLKFILGTEDDIFCSIHGPSLSNSALHDTDLVFCFKCHTWPTIAKNWLLRYRLSEWPPQDVIYNVVDHGVLVVPIGSKSPSSDAPSLCDFRRTPIFISKPLQRLPEFEKAVLPIQSLSTLTMFFSDNTADSLCTSSIYSIYHKYLPRTARKMLTIMFLQGNTTILSSIDSLNGKNKCRYLRRKECLSRILINTFNENISGWLLLAAFFYSTEEYNKMSYILQFSSCVLSLKKSKKSRISLIDYGVFTSERNQFLNADFTDIERCLSHQSLALFYFLQFLYNRKHGNSVAIQSALKLLKQTIEDDSDKSMHFLWLLGTYQFLEKASELSYDIDRDAMCFLQMVNVNKMSEKI